MATLVAEKRHQARSIAKRLQDIDGVDGVCLFGSLARGEPDEWSDIDLLVVAREEELRPTTLLAALPEPLKRERLSFVCYSSEELLDLFKAGSSFIDHLRHEGKVLFDRSGVLRHVLSGPFEPQAGVREELEAELRRLDAYDDLALFKGNLLFCLAQLYAIGKAIVILGVIAGGRREYARDRAFESFRELHPSLRRDVATVEALRPFYRLVTRRRSESLPFPYRGAESQAREAIKAIRRIASEVE